MDNRITNAIKNTVSKISEQKNTQYVGMKNYVRQSIDYFEIAMFPSYTGQESDSCKICPQSSNCKEISDSERRLSAFSKATDKLVKALSCVVDSEKAVELTESLVLQIPSVVSVLKKDIQAAYEGDPAAVSEDEIILSYPSFTAISIFRIAHELYLLGAPIVPRIMTEYAHELTGIDIHPGATIGPYFFIDHGTGVVIGETTTIGEHVKLYQHVTLGAKSFDSLPDGSLVKGIKRHPDIGNNVVIYAGATILGGDTRIGDNCVIGGNVWLTHSVRANQTVVR